MNNTIAPSKIRYILIKSIQRKDQLFLYGERFWFACEKFCKKSRQFYEFCYVDKVHMDGNDSVFKKKKKS